MQGEWANQVFLGIYTRRWKTIVSHSINIQHAYLLQIHLWSDRMSTATRLWWIHLLILLPEEGQGFSPQVCLKCPCLCYLTLSDNTLTLSKKTHTHEADIAAPERREVLTSLKRKAADQPLSATQNLISESLVETSPAVNQILPNQILPNMMYLARVIQRSRAEASGSSQHQEATTSEDFTLPHTCTSTRRDEPFVLYDILSWCV